MAVQGIPVVDGYTTQLEAAKEEAEVRNIAKEIGRDHKLTPGQKTSLMENVKLRIAVLGKATPVELYAKEGLIVIEGKGQGEAQPQLSTPSSPAPQTSLPFPTAGVGAMKRAMEAWNAMATEIEEPEDLVKIQGKPYRRASFWRKAAMAYSVDVRQLSASSDSAREIKGKTVPWAQVNLRLTTPNGRFVESQGMCDGTEKNLSDATEHAIAARAYTRAFCRGMRVLIGFGEPAAEEAVEE